MHSFRLFCVACGIFRIQSCLLFFNDPNRPHIAQCLHQYVRDGDCAFLPTNPKDRVLGFKAINILNSCMYTYIVNLTILTKGYHVFFMLQTSTPDISVDTRGESSPHELLTKLWQFAMRCRNFGHYHEPPKTMKIQRFCPPKNQVIYHKNL